MSSMQTTMKTQFSIKHAASIMQMSNAAVALITKETQHQSMC